MSASRVLFILIALQSATLAASEGTPPAAVTHEVLLEKIAAAKKTLAGRSIGTRRTGSSNVLLAVWNGSADGDIELVGIRDGVSRTPGFVVEQRYRNGVNSDFRIIEPEGYTVLAIKINLVRGRRPVIYTPYTPGIHTPEMVRAGHDYLEKVLTDAADDLDRKGLLSRSVAGLRVSESVSPRILMTILIVEHARYDRFDEIGVGQVVEHVLVVLAANGDDAYDHAISRAGARGLAQFIRSSYRLTRLRYPAAKLPTSFSAGTADHLSAVKAQYCLADWALTALDKETSAELLLPGFEEDLGAYVAAAYNGGEKRAAKALYRYPNSWENRGRGLFSETVNYVRVFRTIYRHLFPPEPPSAPEYRTFDP